MRNVSHEILANLLETLQIGDVVENGDDAAAGRHGELGRLYFESAGSVGKQMKAQLARFASGTHGLNQFIKKRLANDLQQAHSLIAVSAESGRAEESLVAEGHLQFRVDGQYSLGHAGEDGFAPRGFETKVTHQAAQFLADAHQGAF